MTEVIKVIISIVSAVLAFLGTLSGVLVKLVKTAKAKKVLKALNFYIEEASKYVQEAEKYVHYTGQEKKEYVMTSLNRACMNEKIDYDANKISDIVEDIVSLTKKVNAKIKPTVSETEIKTLTDIKEKYLA